MRSVAAQPLNKTEQMSNWSRRPLRTSQLLYAALDAHCQIAIFEYMVVKLATDSTLPPLQQFCCESSRKHGFHGGTGPNSRTSKRSQRRGRAAATDEEKLSVERTESDSKKS